MKHYALTIAEFEQRLRAILKTLPARVTVMRYGKVANRIGLTSLGLLDDTAQDDEPPAVAHSTVAEDPGDNEDRGPEVTQQTEGEGVGYAVPPPSFRHWPLHQRAAWIRSHWPELADEPNAEEAVGERITDLKRLQLIN